jgi:site-specific recombinase XerD
MSNSAAAPPSPRLLERVREVIRIKHYSIRTEQAYLQWIRRYIVFHGRRHPNELGGEELSAFLSDLAIRGKVSASTQNQALNAILFMYREVLKMQLPWIDDVQRAKRSEHLPVVLTLQEVKSLLSQLEGTVAHDEHHVRRRLATARMSAPASQGH